MMIPITISWAQRANVDPRKLLIPMTYAVTFGGTLTLIGTSTNLVVTGLQEKRYSKDPAKAKYGFFEITPYVSYFSLLPTRRATRALFFLFHP